MRTIALTLTAFTGAIFAQNWTQQHPQTNPPVRAQFATSYDSAHNRVVLFGGSGSAANLNDTWLWDGSNWAQQHPQTSPSARFITAMAYDSAHRQTVLFGG